MNVGITGWKGFIGYHLNNKLPNAILFEGNLHDLAECRRFVERCDRIYHLAGKNREEEGKVLANNILSTGNLRLAMELAEISPEIIFISSRQVDWHLRTEYVFTKCVEEEMIKSSLRFLIYRLPNVYGPRCRPFYNSVIATFCHQIALEIPLTVHDLESEREFIFIDDVIDKLFSVPSISPGSLWLRRMRGEILTIGRIAYFLTDGLGEHENLQKTLEWYKENINVSSPQK